ncbi:MAG TPA: preprotein translocase subunit SecG [Gammaproteobacteria bacterium]|nr:preprotein translocase subunit SecG [Gammaproteobacteria bacterium]
MYQLILLVHILVAVCIIAMVIVQQGKGATMGAAFGAGASQTIFGSRGSGSFLLKLTIGFVFIFFSTSIALNYLSTEQYKQTKQIPAKELPLPTIPNR